MSGLSDFKNPGTSHCIRYGCFCLMADCKQSSLKVRIAAVVKTC